MPNSKRPKHLRNQKHGRPSTFKVSEMAVELHELLGIPLQRHGKGGSGDWYEPDTGRRIVHAIAQAMREALQRGESVRIKGFGRFEIRTRRPCRLRPVAYNGERIVRLDHFVDFPERKMVVFIPSPYLRAITNTSRGLPVRESWQRYAKDWATT